MSLITSELLSKPTIWGKGAAALDAKKQPTTLQKGISFSLEGLLQKLYPIHKEQRKVRMRLIKRIWAMPEAYGGGTCIQRFNDAPLTTYHDVLMLCKEVSI